MAGQRPDFSVYVTKKNGEKSFYTRVGSAWAVSNDGISIKLEPNISVANELVLFPPREE